MMTCKELNDLIPDLISGDLEESKMNEINFHLSTCKKCQHELETAQLFWKKLSSIPEEKPSPLLKTRFESMLFAYDEGLNHAQSRRQWRERMNAWIEKWWPVQPIIQLTFATSFLIIGLIFGYLIKSPRNENGHQIAELRNELQDMRQEVSLSLIRNESPGDRLEGIYWTSNIRNPKPELVGALLNSLNNDSNVNIRLAAVDALYLFVDRPDVRKGLIESLPDQESPLVQIALIDLLVSIKEKRSLQVLKQLIQNDRLNNTVKQRIETGLGQLY